MSVRIRMTRMGRRNRAFYRIGAYDARAQRDGFCLENLGWYDPIRKPGEKNLEVNLARVEHWLAQGAQPTEKTAILLKKAGVKFPAKNKKSKKVKKAKKQPAS